MWVKVNNTTHCRRMPTMLPIVIGQWSYETVGQVIINDYKIDGDVFKIDITIVDIKEELLGIDYRFKLVGPIGQEYYTSLRLVADHIYTTPGVYVTTPDVQTNRRIYSGNMFSNLSNVIPPLFSNNVVGVQPMAEPIGLAHALRFTYGREDIQGVWHTSGGNDVG